MFTNSNEQVNDKLWELRLNRFYESTDELVLEASNDEKKCQGYLEIAFQHLIKYEIIRYKQDTDWITSIHKLHKAIDIKKLKKNIYNEINSNIDDTYSKCRSLAYHELKQKKYTEANFVCPISRPAHYNLEFLSSMSEIDDYLKSISLTREVRDHYGLSPELNKEENEIIYHRIKLKDAFPEIK